MIPVYSLEKSPEFDSPEEFYKWRIDYLKDKLIPLPENPKPADFESNLIAQMVRFELDPLGALCYIFAWGSGSLAGYAPENWQIYVLWLWGRHLQNPNTRYLPLNIAIAAGHGIGKSAEFAIVVIIAMSTFALTRARVTANTDTQLKKLTWPELSKWHKLAITSHWFKYEASYLCAKGSDSESWRCDATNWSLVNTTAFAGLHNHGKRIVQIFDESSQIPAEIFEIADGAKTDMNTQILMLAFGNMTHNTGAFYNLFYGHSPDWVVLHVDSRTCRGTNKEFLNGQVEKYGEDSDYVRKRIRGLPPKSNTNQAIPSETISVCRKTVIKHQSQFAHAPCIVGIDGAWTGKDELEVYVRQGNYQKNVFTIKINNNDIKTMSAIVAAVRQKHPFEPDGWIIDLGWGTGLYSAAKSLGLDNVYLVAFGGESPIPGIMNMRTYMWLEMEKWARLGGALGNDIELEKDFSKPGLYTVETGKRAGWVILESKKDMAARGVSSPNKADALACTFAVNIQKREILETAYDASRGVYTTQSDYCSSSGHYAGMI